MTDAQPAEPVRSWRIERLGRENATDFFRLHSPENGAGWCFCAAWWTPTWEGWGERSAKQNRLVREDLLKRGVSDGYLLYSEDRPVGWCQALPRDHLEKLARQFHLPADPHTWAVSCFFIAPEYRRQGAADLLLQGVLEDLARQGARRVEAYPRSGVVEDPEELWTGPEELFRRAGFRLAQAGERRSVYVWEADRDAN